MSPFKSGKQRRGFFANHPSASPPPKSPPSESPPSELPSPELPSLQPSNVGIPNPIIPKITIPDAIIRTGCIFAFSNECLVIKGVYKAYKMYKKESPNEQYDNKIEKLVKSEMPKLTSAVAEDEIKKVSKEIVNQVNNSGLISNISNATEINENIIKNFMEGTISNLLKDKIEIGTGFIINNVM